MRPGFLDGFSQSGGDKDGNLAYIYMHIEIGKTHVVFHPTRWVYFMQTISSDFIGFLRLIVGEMLKFAQAS